MRHFSFQAPRLCDGDYETSGRCYVLGEEKLDWYAARHYCENKLLKNGSLASIEDKMTQDFLAREASRNWDDIWINGFGFIDGKWHSGKKCSIIKVSKCNTTMQQIPDNPAYALYRTDIL